MLVNIEVPEADQDIKSVLTDTEFSDFVGRTHAEHDTYITTNLTDQASTNAYLETVSKLLAACCRKLGIGITP